MIVVIGGGGHAKMIISILKGYYATREIGYTDIDDKGDILGVKYIGLDDVVLEMKGSQAVIGLTYLVSPVDRSLRDMIIRKYSKSSVSFPVVQSKTAIVGESVSIGMGTVILDNAMVNVGAQIGSFCVLNSKVLIEHDVVVGDNSIISPGAIILGGAKIGKNVFLGAGCIVRDGVEIVDNVVLGMGSVVNKDIKSPGIYLGFNAKKYR